MGNIDLEIFKSNFKTEFDKYTYEDWKNRDKGALIPFNELIMKSFMLAGENSELKEGWAYVELWVTLRTNMWKSLECGN